MSTFFMIVLIAIVCLGGASKYFLGDDNPVEEKCEQVIEALTGVDVDLSPQSPESEVRGSTDEEDPQTPKEDNERNPL